MNKKHFITILCAICFSFFYGCSQTELSQLLNANNGFQQLYGLPANNLPANKITFNDEPIPLVDQRLRQLFSINPGVSIDKTSIPGIYAMRPASDKEGCPNYTVADGSVILEHRQPKDEWIYMRSGKTVSTEDELKIKRHIYANLPREATINMASGGRPMPMALYSAIDCGPSAKMEDALKKERIDYRIIPFSLRPENETLVRYAVCSTNPMVTWNDIRAKKITVANMKTLGQCPANYRRDIADIQCMTDVYHFPTALFSDGTTPAYHDLMPAIRQH